MRLNSKKLEEKLKKHNQKAKMSKKQERRVKRKVRQFRKLQRLHHQATLDGLTQGLEEDLERQRIIREVEERQ